MLAQTYLLATTLNFTFAGVESAFPLGSSA